MILFKYNSEKEIMVLKIQKDKNRSPETFALFEKFITNADIDIDNPFILKHIKVVGENWNNVKDRFLNGLSKFYEVKLQEPDLTCYLTRTAIFPYNYKGDSQWFAAPMFGNPAEINRVIMHELCHYLQPTKLPDYIKEAIPVILNDTKIFGSIGVEKGHLKDEAEQKWRKIIWDLYCEGKNYTDLLKFVEKEISN
ncbi:MAG: hypothetical protein WC629_01910 [Candidatus Paceibacterota bacterium]|jgi:hypothetical protein